MKKDIIYFAHDSNARRDPKCAALISDLGLEGYGKFWVLVEFLREQEGEIELTKTNLKAISVELKTDIPGAEKFINDLVNEYGLIKLKDNFIFSERLNSNIEHLNSIRQKRTDAIKSRWNKKTEAENEANSQDLYNCNTNELQMNYKSNTKRYKEKESKVKESKEKNINSGGSGLNTELLSDSQPEVTTTTTELSQDIFSEDTELLNVITSNFETIWNKTPNPAQIKKLVLLAQDERFTHKEILEILQTSFTEIYESDDEKKKNFPYLEKKFAGKKQDRYKKKLEREQRELKKIKELKLAEDYEKQKAEANQDDEDLSSLLEDTASSFENPFKLALNSIAGTNDLKLEKPKRITKSKEELERQFQEALKNEITV